MDYDVNTVLEIVSLIVTLLAMLLGVKWQIAKTKIHEIRKLLDDLAAAVDDVDSALADNKIDENEYKQIVARLVTVSNDFKDLMGKDELNLWLNKMNAKS